MLCVYINIYYMILYSFYEAEKQDTFNQLGMLWCNRGGHKEGLNFLRRAQVMYNRRPKAVEEQCPERCENHYTMTMRLEAVQL